MAKRSRITPLPGKQPVKRAAPLTFTERMWQLDADTSPRPGVRGDSPRAAWITAQTAIAKYARRYNATKNPTFAFEALYWAHKTGEPDPAVAWLAVPAWVIQCFFEIATRTHAVFTSRTPPKNPQNAVYRALGFAPGRNNPVRVLVDDFHDQNIATAVLPRVIRGEQPDHVFDAVARDHPATCYLNPKCKRLSRSTVRRIWQQYGPALQASHAALLQFSAQIEERRRQRGDKPASTYTSLKEIEEKHFGKDAAAKFTVDVSFL